MIVENWDVLIDLYLYSYICFYISFGAWGKRGGGRCWGGGRELFDVTESHLESEDIRVALELGHLMMLDILRICLWAVRLKNFDLMRLPPACRPSLGTSVHLIHTQILRAACCV